jgi:23S rRNA (cytidine1920-2'-O)/16S rRNA (cytidine1409-2'-O)-methyltransferase
MRLDQALLQRGLVASRSVAARLIQDGAVTVNGEQVTKAAFEVSEQSTLELAASRESDFVSRAGAKLEGVFMARPALKPAGYWVDFGQSTGGFTDCLLKHGASRVLGFDVGHDQLHRNLRLDPRVCCVEGRNLREAWPLLRSMRQTASRTSRINDRMADLSAFDRQWPTEGADGVVIDVSFIALSYVIEQAIQCLRMGGCCIALIKPQFELGASAQGRKRWFKHGLIRAGVELRSTLEALVAPFADMGLHFDAQKDLLASVLPGQSGNQEYFLLSQREPAAAKPGAGMAPRVALGKEHPRRRNAP